MEKQKVPEFTSVRDEKVKIIVNFCIRKIDKTERRSRKSCAARLREVWRYAEKIVNMKIAVEDKYRCNIASVT